MMTMDVRQEKLTVLRMEYQRLCNEIAATELSNDKIVGFGLSIVTAGFAYGVAQKVSEVFFFLPIAAIGIFLYAVMQYNRVFWMGGYKRHVEDLINQEISQDILIWESVVRERERRHFVNSSLFVVYTILFISLTIYSTFQVFAMYEMWIGATFSVVTLCLLIVLLVAVGRIWRAFSIAHKISKDIYSKEKLDDK